MAVEKECERCSRTFSRPTGNNRISDAAWASRRYCSPACSSAAYSERMQALRPRKDCAVCGKQIVAAPNRLRRLATCGAEACKATYARDVIAKKVSERKLTDYASGRLSQKRT